MHLPKWRDERWYTTVNEITDFIRVSQVFPLMFLFCSMFFAFHRPTSLVPTTCDGFSDFVFYDLDTLEDHWSLILQKVPWFWPAGVFSSLPRGLGFGEYHGGGLPLASHPIRGTWHRTVFLLVMLTPIARLKWWRCPGFSTVNTLFLPFCALMVWSKLPSPLHTQGEGIRFYLPDRGVTRCVLAETEAHRSFCVLPDWWLRTFTQMPAV